MDGDESGEEFGGSDGDEGEELEARGQEKEAIEGDSLDEGSTKALLKGEVDEDFEEISKVQTARAKDLLKLLDSEG